MRKQRMTFVVFVLLFFTMHILQSCLDDNEKNYSQLTIATTRIVEGRDFYFALDDGSKMYPGDTTHVTNYTIKEGQRAFVYFDFLEQAVNGYKHNAMIYRIEDILTKDVYYMPAEKADSIGDDRINVTNMWIAGDYLNIQYQFFHSNNPDKKHMLNLVVNEASDGTGDVNEYLTLEFRHNAYKDEQRIPGKSLVSFKLDKVSELMNGKKGLNIRTNTLYDGVKYQTVDLKDTQK